MKKELIILILLLAVAMCNAQTDVYKITTSGTLYLDTVLYKPKSDTTQCYIVFIEPNAGDFIFDQGHTLWMVGYKVEKPVYHPADPFYMPRPVSDWYMEFDKYLDNNKKPLKSSVIVLMSKRIK